MTVAAALAGFCEAIGKDAAPDPAALGALVEYINDNYPFERGLLTRKPKKSRLMHPFWLSLRELDRTGTEVLKSLQWQRQEMADTATRFSIDISERDRDLEDLARLLRTASKLRQKLFLGHYGTRHERWHEIASDIVPMVGAIFVSAGFKTADLQTPTSPGVKFLKWSLERFGCFVEPEAIAQMIKRRRKTTKSR